MNRYAQERRKRSTIKKEASIGKKRSVELAIIAQKCAKGARMEDAIKEVSGKKETPETYLSSIPKDVVDSCLSRWRTNDYMKDFDHYFQDAAKSGTLTERRDALNLRSKILGLQKDVQNIQVQTTSQEERKKNIAKVLELVKSKQAAAE